MRPCYAFVVFGEIDTPKSAKPEIGSTQRRFLEHGVHGGTCRARCASEGQLVYARIYFPWPSDLAFFVDRLSSIKSSSFI